MGRRFPVTPRGDSQSPMASRIKAALAEARRRSGSGEPSGTMSRQHRRPQGNGVPERGKLDGQAGDTDRCLHPAPVFGPAADGLLRRGSPAQPEEDLPKLKAQSRVDGLLKIRPGVEMADTQKRPPFSDHTTQ